MHAEGTLIWIEEPIRQCRTPCVQLVDEMLYSGYDERFIINKLKRLRATYACSETVWTLEQFTLMRDGGQSSPSGGNSAAGSGAR